MAKSCALLRLFALTILLCFPFACHAGRCDDLLLKVQNQFYHIKTGRFVWMRTLHQLLKSVPTERKWLYLWELKPIHPIDYPLSRMQRKLEQRALVMEMFHDEILEQGLSIEAQKDLLPSTGPIRVVPLLHQIVKDGNGRLEALYRTFGWENLRVEVEEYKTQNPMVPYLVHRARVAGELE